MDNWMWPRHTGDFSMFRIYADSANHPAEYSANNVPYKPKKFLTISMKGVKENDFEMVYGFPGRTQEYVSSSAVNMTQHIDDPSKVKVRDVKLKIWYNAMSENDTVRLQYWSKYATIANYYKKWKGEIHGLERADAIGRKKEYEQKFTQWLDENNVPQYKDVLADLESAYSELMPLSRLYDYYNEAIIGTGVNQLHQRNHSSARRSCQKRHNNPQRHPESRCQQDFKRHYFFFQKLPPRD